MLSKIEEAYVKRSLKELDALAVPTFRKLNKRRDFKSALMLSCNNIKHLSKIESLNADCIILNLEDGVSKEDKRHVAISNSCHGNERIRNERIRNESSVSRDAQFSAGPSPSLSSQLLFPSPVSLFAGAYWDHGSLQRCEGVLRDQLAVIEQPADKGALAIVNAAGSGEAQQADIRSGTGCRADGGSICHQK